MIKTLATLLLLCGLAIAQPGPGIITSNPLLVGSPPGGLGAACSTTAVAYLMPTGQIATCQSGLWAASGGSSSSVKVLYYAPAAKNVNGVGVSAFQCNSTCGVPTAIATGTSVTATLHITGSSMTNQDQFVIPSGFSNQAITIEVKFRTADNTGGHTGTATFTSQQVGADGDISNPTFANSTAITLTPSSTASGYTTATGTFTPSWTAGNTGFWKAAWNVGTITQDLEIISVRFYATF